MKYFGTLGKRISIFIFMIVIGPNLATAGTHSDLAKGRQYVVFFSKALGTINAGEKFVIQFSPTTLETTASSVSRYNAIAKYRNANFLSDYRISVWGALLLVDESASCLKDKKGECVARILGPLDPRGINSDITLVVDQTKYAVNYYLTSPSSCTVGNKILAAPYQNIRGLADVLYYSARALPLITNKDQHATMRDNLKTAADYLLVNHTRVYRTSYTDCYGSPEIQTNFMVSRGLYEYYKVTHDRRIPTKIVAWWNELVSQGAIAWVQTVTMNTSARMTANFFARYLHNAVIAQRFGVKALQPSFTDYGIQRVLFAQVTTAEQTRCGNALLTFGGWEHTASDCNQFMSYHEFIVSAFSELQNYLDEKSYCQSTNDWSFSCSNIKWNMLAATTWILNLQDNKSGMIWDRAEIYPGISRSNGTAPAGFLLTRFQANYPSLMNQINVKTSLAKALKSASGTSAIRYIVPAYLRLQVD